MSEIRAYARRPFPRPCGRLPASPPRTWATTRSPRTYLPGTWARAASCAVRPARCPLAGAGVSLLRLATCVPCHAPHLPPLPRRRSPRAPLRWVRRRAPAASRAAWAAPGASARGDSLSAPPLPRAPPARPHCPLPRGPHRGPAPAAARRAAAAALAPPGALAVSSTWWLSRPTARAAPAGGEGHGAAWSEQAADSVRKLRCERALALNPSRKYPAVRCPAGRPTGGGQQGGGQLEGRAEEGRQGRASPSPPPRAPRAAAGQGHSEGRRGRAQGRAAASLRFAGAAPSFALPWPRAM